MVSTRELRVWSLTLKQWAAKLEDVRTAEQAARLADEFSRLAMHTEITSSGRVSKENAPR